MSYTQSYDPDTVPSYPIRRGLIFGSKCPISHQEFLNLTPVNGRNAVDDTIKMETLVAAQKLHTWGLIVLQDTINDVWTPRNMSIQDRRNLWLRDNA